MIDPNDNFKLNLISIIGLKQKQNPKHTFSLSILTDNIEESVCEGIAVCITDVTLHNIAVLLRQGGDGQIIPRSIKKASRVL